MINMKHIADIKKFERCKRMLWHSIHNPQPIYPFVTYNESIVELVKDKLNVTTYIEGVRNDSNDVFFHHQDSFDTFFNMRFEYNDLRVKVPLLQKVDGGYKMSFLYPSCFPKESEAQGIADTLWVLEKLNLEVVEFSVFHLRHDYVRDDNLDANALLNEIDYLYNERNKPGNKLTKLLKRKKRDLEAVLKAMDKYLAKEDKREPKRTQMCTKRNKCPYVNQCFPNEDDTSILNLVSSSKKFDLYKAGVKHIEDVDFSQIEGTRHQFAQYMAATKKKLFFDKAGVMNFFHDITYPISYLDFEWETFAYPPYKGMKPYDVLAFQYSLHIEDEHHHVEHKDYLGKRDCRIDFIEHLIKDIPSKGSIICFNVEGAEKLRLRQLAKLYPQYADILQSIWERMIDLATPFSNGLIYDTRMAGMYSLKKLVSIFTDYSYDDLEISHGLEAVRSYVDLENNENEEVIEDLLKYCAMDTYAMYLIYHWMLKNLE